MGLFSNLEAPLFFDGGMGSMLLARGLAAGDLPERLNVEKPDEITHIHRLYRQAGADIITANTFGANPLKFSELETVRVIHAAMACARAAEPGPVALDVGPLGQLLQPLGTLSFEEAYQLFVIVMKAGAEAGADLILIETLSDLYEAKAAVLAAREVTDLPVCCTMSFDRDGRTFLGCGADTAAVALSAYGVDALGVNCSLGPEHLYPIVETMAAHTQKPIIVQANAGLPGQEGGRSVYDCTPSDFARHNVALCKRGARILGGCCGTTPDHIAALRQAVGKGFGHRHLPAPITACTSGTRTVVLDRAVTVIGERINPTGKKRLQAALRQGDIAYLLSEALAQKENGADILDVNVGLPDIDEPAMLSRVIQEIQGVVDCPLQIDSTHPQAIETALRRVNGKPIVNSVSGKQETLDAILPLCRKYGALVVGLTLDESGIPETAQERLAIARRIVEQGAKHGIPPTDFLIDCLVLTASAQQSQVRETLRAVALVKAELGVKTLLGVSNVSFGLPERPLLGSVFLSAAFGAGLDAAIINPLSEPFRRTVHAYRVINGQDAAAEKYIERYTATPDDRPSTPSPGDLQGGKVLSLTDMIAQGRREDTAAEVTRLLATTPPLDIINGYFIPALDRVGDGFAAGKLFLPRLLQAAAAVQAGFAVLPTDDNPGEQAGRGKVLLATVKGDVHDIGKNIVRMLLQSYGYNVVDLGKDVAPEAIVETVKTHQIKLCGLSALMTTTVLNIKNTIQAVRAAGLDCRFMVGGAVLTDDYARLVEADYYAPDAMAGVRIAAEVLG